MINEKMKDYLDVLHEDGKACIYSKKDAEDFKLFLEAVYYPFNIEDASDRGVVSELFYFTKK